MFSSSRGLKRVCGGLFFVSVLACFAVSGCSDIRPEPNEEGGLLESPTHEQDALHQEEQRQEQHR